MRARLPGALVASAAVISVFAIGCPASLDDRCSGGACAPRADSSGDGDGGAGEGAAPDSCIGDPTNPACIDDGVALFVSYPNGDDANVGTKASPFKTINNAIANVNQVKRRIYVCTAAYPEDVVIDDQHSAYGVSLFGGVDCAWNPVATKPNVGAGVVALRVKNAQGPVAIANMSFTSIDASDGSSIGGFFVSSTVALSSVDLTSGAGAKGADASASGYTFPAADQLDGNNALADNNGAGEKSYTCPGNHVTVGGAGGAPGAGGQPGTPGAPNGATIAMCNVGGTGGNGSVGATALDASGADSPGTLTATGWVPASGKNGDDGAPGQGGGGGAGLLSMTNAGGGGSGGAGGCGGHGGNGGGGGGASIALAIFGGNVTIHACSLKSGAGGKGGKGGAGQAGQISSGAGGGKYLPGGTGCNGGNGGAGGSGGAGGGGAGGLSVPIAYSGVSAPVIDPATLTVPGTPGQGGAGGSASGANAGVTPAIGPIYPSP